MTKETITFTYQGGPKDGQTVELTVSKQQDEHFENSNRYVIELRVQAFRG